MIELLRSWILGVAGAALLAGVVLALTPRGRVHSVLRLVCGAVMVLALLGPLQNFDYGNYSMRLAQYREEANSITQDAELQAERLSRTLIEAEYAAYILDKAQGLGLDCRAAIVEVKWGDTGCWYPYAVTLEITGPAEAREKLAADLEARLGIPRQRQKWSETNT